MDSYYDGAAAAAGAGMIIFEIIMIAFVVVVLAGAWKMFVKAGEPGWAAIIPIFNSYKLFKIAWGSGIMFLLLFVPVVDVIIMIMLQFKLSRAFGLGDGYAFGLLFLPVVFYPMIGFGDAKYIGPDGQAQNNVYVVNQYYYGDQTNINAQNVAGANGFNGEQLQESLDNVRNDVAGAFNNNGYDNQQYGYDNQQYNYDNQQYGYDNQQYGYDDQQYGYDNQQYGYDNQQYGYDNQQYGYDSQQYDDPYQQQLNAPSASPGFDQAGEEFKFCASCGAQINKSAKFCKYCGTPVASADSDPYLSGGYQEPAYQEPVYQEPAGASDFGERTEVLFEDPIVTGPSLRLIFAGEDGQEKEIRISGTPFVIGRTTANADYALETRGVSRRHLQVDYDNGSYYITDLNSTNGVQLNGSKITPMERVTIEKNDIIKVGQIGLKVEV